MSEALFEVVDETEGVGTYQPTEQGRGPWSPNALHGGPVAALLARSYERVPTARPMHPARITMELLYPLPLEPLSVRVFPVRAGKRVQVLGAEVTKAGDTQVLARSTLQQIRYQAMELPKYSDDTTGPAADPPPPSEAAGSQPDWGYPHVAFHSHATEHRVVRGTWNELGPTTDWIRLAVPVVAGEEPSPLQRLAAAADFGNGISAALPYGEYVFINPDLTVYVYRLPVGEWVCLDAATYLSDQGVGQAECTLFDEQGRLGHSAQSLLVEPFAP
jgi:hypothetical protein